MSVLHLGTFDPDALIDLLPAEHNPSRCLGVEGSPSEWRFKFGDSWEEWGEGRDPESGQPERVVVYGASHELMADLAWVLDQSPGLLQPMTYPNQQGTLACITPEDDESEPWYTIDDTQAQRFIRRLIRDKGANEAEIWRHPEWRERQGLAPLITPAEQ